MATTERIYAGEIQPGDRFCDGDTTAIVVDVDQHPKSELVRVLTTNGTRYYNIHDRVTVI